MLGMLNSVERYNVATNKWEQIESMSTQRGWHGMASTDEYLIVAGGCERWPTALSTCECFM